MEFHEMNGPLAIQEYIQDHIRHNPNDIKKIIELPKGCDKTQWQYEHVKQFIIEINILVVKLRKVCNITTCPIMRVENESYKCTVHKEWRECCAIEYMLHNLDNSTDMILAMKNNFNKMVGIENVIKSLHQICRRLYRLFSHAILYHKDTFTEFETEMVVYKRFYEFMLMFQILTADNLIKPFI